MKKIVVFGLILISVFSCSTDSSIEPKNNISFYHWKSNADYHKSYDIALKSAQSNKVYMHYFDVVNKQSEYVLSPVYVLKRVDQAYKNLDITPVIYIENRVFQSSYLNLPDLVLKLKTG